MIDHCRTTDEGDQPAARKLLAAADSEWARLGVEVTRQNSSRLALARQLPSDPFSLYRRDHLALPVAASA